MTAAAPPDPQPAAAVDTTANGASSSEPASKKRKILGREFYESIGSPTCVVAPMVDQSELAWRLLSRRHSRPETLCYTPMFHSRIFASHPKYRAESYFAPQLDGNPATDRPTFVQFCSNKPEDLLGAARHIEDHCDAVDLNLGCPQGIARKGHYGAFLQEDWKLIASLIRELADNLVVPVTAKIRILETKERSLEYAKMVVDAGATVLTVHGRTREQKGHNTGLADWSVIRYIRDNMPQEIVMFANGNILWHEDIPRCLAATGCDGVMSAEGNLYNPAIFTSSKSWEDRFPRMDHMAQAYIDIVRNEILPSLPLEELKKKERTKRVKREIEGVLQNASLTAMKSHLFKMLHGLLPRHTHVRDLLSKASARQLGPDDCPLWMYDEVVRATREVVENELKGHPEEVGEDGRWVGPDTPHVEGATGNVVELEDGSKVLRNVPWYRCQPYLRPLPEEALEKGAMQLKKKKENKGSAGKTRKAEVQEEDEEMRKKVKLNHTSDELVNGDVTPNEDGTVPMG